MDGVPARFPSEKNCARFRQRTELPGVALYQAHLSRYASEHHTHEASGIGTSEAGVERFRYRGTEYTAPENALVMMNPDARHTDESACEKSGCYQTIYI